MTRRPPRSTRTDTLFPYTTLFRSHFRGNDKDMKCQSSPRPASGRERVFRLTDPLPAALIFVAHLPRLVEPRIGIGRRCGYGCGRSEERRVGKECVSTCRSRWSQYHKKKKKQLQRKTDTRSDRG